MARTNLPIEDKMTFRVRGDNVLVCIHNKGEVNGIAMPDVSIQGKEFLVVAKGPDVGEDLNVGDMVLMLGAKNVTYFEVPFEPKLIIIKQEFVVLVLEENE